MPKAAVEKNVATFSIWTISDNSSAGTCEVIIGTFGKIVFQLVFSLGCGLIISLSIL